MNRYLLILYGGDEKIARMSPNEIQQHMQRWANWMETLSKQGIIEGGEPLEAAAKVIKGPQKLVSDGPYIEAKEAIGGYVILKANTAEAAVEIAKSCPLFEVDGTVEVRQIQMMPM